MCSNLFQVDSLIKCLRQGVYEGNVGYRRALGFKDNQYIKHHRDPHDQIMKFDQDYLVIDDIEENSEEETEE